MAKGKPGRTRTNFIKRFFSVLGPGLITGAADDDPSGIATYSIAGAHLGTSLLWTAFITWPLMAPVQMMCARIGLVTGKGLAGALRDKFPKRLIALVAVALLIANTITSAQISPVWPTPPQCSPGLTLFILSSYSASLSPSRPFGSVTIKLLMF